MNTYTTVQGDMWDSIAYKLFGTTDGVGALMNANQRYSELYTFPAGVTLNVPTVAQAASVTLPPWKQVAK